MKIQTMAIILIIIILPITLILTAYTKTQIDTISVQTLYTTKLKDATYDAVSAFQLNTVHNTFSTVSDSMRRDITAAIQTFMSTLASNLGMSGATEASLKPYVPAIVFTLYDGYYIYAPSYSYKELDKEENTGDGYIVKSEEESINTDGVIDKTSDKNNATYEHVLKPYIYYTVRYTPDSIPNTDLVVNYSLDNYVVIYGKYRGETITKAGYLVASRPKINENEVLKRNLPVTTITFTPPTTEEGNRSRINDIAILNIAVKEVVVTDSYLLQDRLSNHSDTINITKEMIDSNAGLKKVYFKKDQYMTGGYKADIYVEGEYQLGEYIDPKSENYYVDPESAKKYYDEAEKFTKWVTENLGTIKASDAIKPDGSSYDEFGDDKIFMIDSNNDPEDAGSAFNEHRREAIKLSIEDNLAQAIASYNQNSEALGSTYNFKMPILSETEWDQVLSNVCMISFLQGLQAGTKIYNNYSIVTSTKNKEYVAPDSIYYINSEGGDGKYHRLGCSHLNDDHIVGYKNTDFDRLSYEWEDFQRDVSNNPILDANGKNLYEDKTEYYFMHKEQACYYCIVNSTEEGNEVDWRNNTERLRAYYTALAREKYNFYKTNSYFPTNE